MAFDLTVVGHSGYAGRMTEGEWNLSALDEMGTQIRCTARVADTLYAFSSSGKIFASTGGGWNELGFSFEHAPLRSRSFGTSLLVALDGGYLGAYRSGYGWSEWQHWSDGKRVFDVCGLESWENYITADICWILVGEDGRIETSGQGVASSSMPWTRRDSPFFGLPILTICRGAGRWIAAGAAGMLASSEDGITWEMREAGFGGSTINHVAYDPALGWIAVGSENKIARSADGYSWWSETPQAQCAPYHSDPAGLVVGHRWLHATAVSDTCWAVVGDTNAIMMSCQCHPTSGSVGTRFKLVNLGLLDTAGVCVGTIGDESSNVPAEVDASFGMTRPDLPKSAIYYSVPKAIGSSLRYGRLIGIYDLETEELVSSLSNLSASFTTTVINSGQIGIPGYYLYVSEGKEITTCLESSPVDLVVYEIPPFDSPDILVTTSGDNFIYIGDTALSYYEISTQVQVSAQIVFEGETYTAIPVVINFNETYCPGC